MIILKRIPLKACHHLSSPLSCLRNTNNNIIINKLHTQNNVINYIEYIYYYSSNHYTSSLLTRCPLLNFSSYCPCPVCRVCGQTKKNLVSRFCSGNKTLTEKTTTCYFLQLCHNDAMQLMRVQPQNTDALMFLPPLSDNYHGKQ